MKISISQNDILLWEKEHATHQQGFYVTLMHNMVKNYYAKNGKLIDAIKRKDRELINEFFDLEVVDGVEQIKMISVPSLDINNSEPKMQKVYKDGKTEEEYNERVKSFLTHKVVIEI